MVSTSTRLLKAAAPSAVPREHKDTIVQSATSSSDLPEYKPCRLVNIKIRLDDLATRSKILSACVDRLNTERAKRTRQLGMHFEMDMDSVNDAREQVFGKRRMMLDAMTYLETALGSQARLERTKFESGEFGEMGRGVGSYGDGKASGMGPEGPGEEHEDLTTERTSQGPRYVDEVQEDGDLPMKDRRWRLEQIELLKWRR